MLSVMMDDAQSKLSFFLQDVADFTIYHRFYYSEDAGDSLPPGLIVTDIFNVFALPALTRTYSIGS